VRILSPNDVCERMALLIEAAKKLAEAGCTAGADG
jgi:hypothetical protein